MLLVDQFFILEAGLKLSLVLSLSSALLASLVLFLLSFKGLGGPGWGGYGLALVKYFSLFCMLASFFGYLATFFYFFGLLDATNIAMIHGDHIMQTRFTDVELFGFRVSLDLFGHTLLILAYLIGLFSLLTIDSRLGYLSYRFLLYFNFFVIIVFFFVTVSDILLFFFFYELLVLPSFFFVYFVSYSKKAIQASLYFIIWTQVGSILVLLGSFFIVSRVGESSFLAIKSFNFEPREVTIAISLLFIGFGIKVPIWPTHYWLTKTHVEAPSGFSIYLSGFLVKSALFGFFKLSLILASEVSMVLANCVAILGVVDASLKM
jgi:NADH:ubiquinone oxidoreductase subunit 4 (subunit M)